MKKNFPSFMFFTTFIFMFILYFSGAILSKIYIFQSEGLKKDIKGDGPTGGMMRLEE